MKKRNIKNTKKTKSKSKNTHVKNNLYQEIITIFIIAMGLLIGISFFSDTAGIFGQNFKALCLGLFGYVAYMIPVFLIGYGTHYFLKKDDFHFKHTYKYWLGLGALFLFSAIGHIIAYRPNEAVHFKDNIIMFYRLGQAGQGGGAVGYLIAEPIIGMFGIWGAMIVVVTCIIVFLMLITEISMSSMIQYIRGFLKKGFNFFKQNFSKVAKGLKTFYQHKYKEEDIFIEGSEDSVIEEIQEQPITEDEPIKIYDHEELTKNEIIEHSIDYPTDDTIEPTEIVQDNVKENNEDMDNITFVNEHIRYAFPPIDLLNVGETNHNKKGSNQSLRNNAKKLVETLKSFGVEAKVLQVSKGPSVTRYELQPSAGVKVSKIVSLSDDIALNLAAQDVRIEAPIPGKAAIGIEVPNKEITPVYLREVIEKDDFCQHPSKLAFALGKGITGHSVIADIAKMPHLLIAGATGSGKSVCINTLITSILYKATPNEVRLVMIDPKVVELGVYNGIPHLLIPVVTDPKKAAGALNWAVQEMVNRYKLFADSNVRDLKSYNNLLIEKGEENTLPEIVIIIDELADLMMVAPGDVEDSICRLAQMARAAGMHLVIATQRPSVNVITGVIKANIPSRISFAVSSQVDSRTILDSAGAEKLLGRGDMLFYPVGAPKPIRLQGAFISDKEVERVVEYIKMHSGANYQEEIIEKIESQQDSNVIEEEDVDELLPQAIELVVNAEQASVSMLQRRLKVGHARAARLVDQMEARGIVGEFEGSKPRQVLITKEQYNEMLMNRES